MEHDETSKLADVQTKPADLADLLVGDLADEPAEPAAVVKTTEPAAEPAEQEQKQLSQEQKQLSQEQK